MEENIKNKEIKLKSLYRISIYFALLLLVFLLVQGYLMGSVLAADETNDFCYLSDMNWKSGSGYKSILKDTTSAGSKISVKIEGAYYTFDKGIWAHAASTVIYDLTTTPNSEKYDYFTAYLGLNQTAASSSNGVIFKIYTSTDGTNWSIKYNEASKVCKPGENATFVKIDISEAKFLKLEAGHNGGNGNDHSVYADAKLIKENYKEPGEDLVPSIKELDEKIKTQFANADLGANKEYELTLLKRELISRVGNYALRRFLSASDANKAVYEWLTGDVDNLRLYIMGGTPAGGSYYNSLTQLSRLYNEYSEDFKNEKLLNNKWYPDLTYGDLYKKMAITISLTHSQTVALWMHTGPKVNQSDALRRYAIFKYLHDDGKLKASNSIDTTPLFEALQVEEMRFIMNNSIDDEEILWLNAYVKTKIIEEPKKAWLTPHPHMAYVWPNYTNKLYYENDDYFNDLFKVRAETLNEDYVKDINKTGLFDLTFKIPGGKNISEYEISITKGTINNKISKVWMNFRNKFGTGAVCGGISKSGSNIRATHGIPATVIGQPGHAALLFYSKDANGKGYWGIDNDVSGWSLSEKGERMLLGWGNGYGYSVVYMALAQEVLNDYENLVKCEEQVMLAKVYNDDLANETKKQDTLAKQEEIYRKALEIQSINIDAWRGLINVYNQSTSKTEKDYFELAEELATKLKCFPLPMYHLTNLIKPKLTSVENTYKFALLQTSILKEGAQEYNKTGVDNTGIGNTGNFEYHVYQPNVTRTEANYLLKKIDNSIAKFSFDGADAGKIVLSSRFDGNGVRWDYSLDGKQTWKEVSFTAEEEHKLQLTQEQINSITAENDIYVHIVGVNYDEKNLYKIDITTQASLANLFDNDLENRVVGVNLNTEWRYTENDAWTSYSKASPDLTGDKTVQVRQAATGAKLASDASPIYTFTEDNQPDTRKYIPVSHLSIHEVSSQAVNNQGAATNAIDANYNTRWHSDWNGRDTNRFITIKLDKPVYLSAVEFVPAGGGNGKIFDGTIWGSMDGENWEKLTSRENIKYANLATTVEQAKDLIQNFEINESKEVQYVKIVADNASHGSSMARDGNWFTARAFNLYEDLTKKPNKTEPTVSIVYSPSEQTNGPVIARLVNPSTKITITNNDGKDTYIFTENNKPFTFEFEDADGNKGYSTANVTWIDKEGPTAEVKYKLDPDKKLLVLLDEISEDVYLLDEDNNKINYVEVEDGKVTSIAYLDNEGNEYKVVEYDKDGNVNKITYKNRAEDESVKNIGKYITTITNGVVTKEEYIDIQGWSTEVNDEDQKEILRELQQAISNPLEQVLETSGEYEFRLLDKASNILHKNVKVDYIDNDTKILASSITYNITTLTNQNVEATIKPYIIDTDGNKDVNVTITNNEGRDTYTFTKNGEFTFEYKDVADTNNWEIKEHTAKVDWIDKTAPTAEVKYSTEEPTDKEVVASLVNESEEIIIRNNGTSREYTFTENGEFTFEFQDIAGNKGTLVAKVDWIEKETENPDKPDNPNNPENPEIKDEITSEKYKIEDSFISRIAPNTTVSDFKQNVKANKDIVITNKDGKVLKEDEIIETGAKIKAGETKYTAIVIGDIDGNGKITLIDLSNMKLHLINKKLLTGIYLKAADINGDGKVSIIDLSQLKLILIGKLEIN